MRMRHLLSTLALGAVATALSAAAQAETLREALAKAYENNPTLTATRAQQRAQDENVPIAKSDGLPSAGTNASVEERLFGRGAGAPDRTFNTSVSASVPIYQGGRVKNAVKAAEQRVEAGQADLRATEASIFSQTVAAYMDVLRDQAIVSLNRGNVGVLEVNLEATKDRFQIGDLTRTDIAQSDSRLAVARGQLRNAEAQLISSRERYIELVGEAPVNLQTPPSLPNLPKSANEAVEIALANNPDIESAQRQAEATRYDVKAAKGARMPQISGTASTGYTNYLGSLDGTTVSANPDQDFMSGAAGVSVTFPLFQGGRPSAVVRQAQARQSQAMEVIIATERSVIAQTRSAYASHLASQDVITSSTTAVEASTLSLEGVRAENSVGSRTILDILNAEQELLNAQVQLVAAERNAYVAGFSLLAAMGRAEAQDLGLEGGTLYQPEVNYNRVKGKIFDWDDDPTPTIQSTSTAATVPQDATVPELPRPKAPTTAPIKR